MGKLRFTTERLAKLTCPAGKDRIYFHDQSTLGLALCVTTAGTKTFILYRRINGRPARIRLGLWPQELSVDDARREAQKQNGEIARGVDPRQAKRAIRAEMTFSELFNHHLENAKVHNRTWQENERQYERYLKSWRGCRLSEIKRADVQALHARLGQNHGKYAANRALAMIHHMFADTATSLGWEKGNPAHGIQKFKEQSRERFLHANEMPRFFAALEAEPEEIFRDFFLLALLTGARRGNVQAMTWDDVHLDRAEWRIPVTKSGEPVTVPLCPEAVEIMIRRQADCNGSPFVFASRGKSGHLEEPKTAWKRILTRAGIADLRLHDLRRTMGSWQAATGASLPIIGKFLGHKNQQTTAIYARLAIEPVRAAVNTAAAAIVAAGKPNGGNQ